MINTDYHQTSFISQKRTVEIRQTLFAQSRLSWPYRDAAAAKLTVFWEELGDE